MMAIEMKAKSVLSTDGEHQLSGRVYLPEGEPIGLFQAVHGMTEHIERYDSFMREIAALGYIVFGYDHLGHGYTARDASELGFIAAEDGWKRLIEDVDKFYQSVADEYGRDLPYILMGHSMGSFIVRLTAEKFNHYDRLIVMGTGGPNPVGGLGLKVVRSQKKKLGDHGYSDLVEKLAFGSYNKRFGDDDRYNWLSKLQKTRDDYRADRLCTFRFTTSALEDLIRLNNNSNRKEWFKNIDKTKPILLVSGAEDPVGEYGKGVTKVYRNLVKAGANVEMKLYYDCRHEILNETCRDEVIADITAFLKKA